MSKVSVILPVYNGEKYLREAIDSILAQTFSDFELLLLNDGSTDASESIIQSYADDRIVYIKNEKNCGLIYTLNKGIDLAKGEYIARMDADDIAFAKRLEKQLAFLEKANALLLFTRVNLIDAGGNSLPNWADDANNTTQEQIKSFLKKDNCLAHPTVMGKASVFKKYRYRYNQKYSEDYDFWLRCLADGLRLEKLPEPLLLHRILPTSATRFKKVNLYYRLAKVKFRFLWPQMKKRRLTTFNAGVLLYAMTDLVKAAGKEIKLLVAK
jgi:glycosyltransferase involved in cell wall biosynthesis